mgnify:CR=1 FL=1
MTGFEYRYRCRTESNPQEKTRLRADTRDHEIALATDHHRRVGWPDAARRTDRTTFITPSDQPGGLTGGVDATHLRRYRGHTPDGEGEHRDQGGNRQCRFDGGESAIAS